MRAAMSGFFSLRSNALYDDLDEEEEDESPRHPPTRMFSQP
jgi:hypothetical protein